MAVQDQPTKLTNLQLELLKIFSRNISEEQLLEIRSILAAYFAEKIDKDFEKIEKERGWKSDTYSQWAKEHMRASSKK